MRKVISVIKEFSQRFKIGVELQAATINVPIWLSCILSLLLVPVSLTILVVMLIIGGQQMVRNFVSEIIYSYRKA